MLTQFIPESFCEGTAWWSKALYTMIQETEIQELRLGVHNPLERYSRVTQDFPVRPPSYGSCHLLTTGPELLIPGRLWKAGIQMVGSCI